MAQFEEQLDAAMAALRGQMRSSGRSVRAVAKWSNNQRCATNNAMFVARVDDDRLLQRTSLAPEFGQSPFALARGARVEQIGRANQYAVTVSLLREHFGYGIPEVVALDLRHGFQPNNIGMAQRARATERALQAAIRDERDAPNIIDGAVLRAQIGGFLAHLEADGVGAKTGPVFHVNEYKGWPVVDGRAHDAAKLGATVAQMGIYRYLLADTIDRLGGDPDTVAGTGLLITPRNVGLTLVGNPIRLAGATRLAEHTLANLPHPRDFIGSLPEGLDFGAVARGDHEGSRLDALERITNRLGTRYQESCMGNCGLAKFCRARARASGSTSLVGESVARFMPGVVSLPRAAALADGATPAEGEVVTGAASVLAAAGRLYREKLSGGSLPPIAAVGGGRAS